ncbi:MAG: hypothetical protein WBB45_03625 [Cyclobacteriaceae bacterium]
MLKDLSIESFITDRENIRGGITHSSNTDPWNCATPHGPCDNEIE